MPRATSGAIMGSRGWVGGARWGGEVGRQVAGRVIFDQNREKCGWSKIDGEKLGAGAGGRKNRCGTVPLEVFIVSIGPRLHFDAYYSLWDPLVGAVDFF